MGGGEEVRLGCRVRTLPAVFALRREHYNEEDSKPVLIDASVDDGLGHRLGVRPRKLDCQQQANLCVCVFTQASGQITCFQLQLAGLG